MTNIQEVLEDLVEFSKRDEKYAPLLPKLRSAIVLDCTHSKPSSTNVAPGNCNHPSEVVPSFRIGLQRF